MIPAESTGKLGHDGDIGTGDGSVMNWMAAVLIDHFTIGSS